MRHSYDALWFKGWSVGYPFSFVDIFVTSSNLKLKITTSPEQVRVLLLPFNSALGTGREIITITPVG